MLWQCIDKSVQCIFYGNAQGGTKNGANVLRLVTFKVLAPNLAQINAIPFLTLPRDLFESTLEHKVAPSGEWQ